MQCCLGWGCFECCVLLCVLWELTTTQGALVLPFPSLHSWAASPNKRRAWRPRPPAALLTQLSQPVSGGLSCIRTPLTSVLTPEPPQQRPCPMLALPPCRVHAGGPSAARGPSATQALWEQEGGVRLAAQSEPTHSCCPDKKPQVGRWAGSSLCILPFLLQHPSDCAPRGPLEGESWGTRCRTAGFQRGWGSQCTATRSRAVVR